MRRSGEGSWKGSCFGLELRSSAAVDGSGVGFFARAGQYLSWNWYHIRIRIQKFPRARIDYKSNKGKGIFTGIPDVDMVVTSVLEKTRAPDSFAAVKRLPTSNVRLSERPRNISLNTFGRLEHIATFVLLRELMCTREFDRGGHQHEMRQLFQQPASCGQLGCANTNLTITTPSYTFNFNFK
jgi:hypothetical protein